MHGRGSFTKRGNMAYFFPASVLRYIVSMFLFTILVHPFFTAWLGPGLPRSPFRLFCFVLVCYGRGLTGRWAGMEGREGMTLTIEMIYLFSYVFPSLFGELGWGMRWDEARGGMHAIALLLCC